jgi:hypothetical protein
MPGMLDTSADLIVLIMDRLELQYPAYSALDFSQFTPPHSRYSTWQVCESEVYLYNESFSRSDLSLSQASVTPIMTNFFLVDQRFLIYVTNWTVYKSLRYPIPISLAYVYIYLPWSNLNLECSNV